MASSARRRNSGAPPRPRANRVAWWPCGHGHAECARELVDEGPGAPNLPTDALDFLADHPGAISSIAIYNRELSAADVARWFSVEKR